MYWNEGAHARPHFYARYAGQAASVGFDVDNWERACLEEPSSRSSRFRNMVAVEALVDITGVEVVGEYRLRLTFADGTVGEVDFGEREWGGVFEPLRDQMYFARVAVDPEAGTIAWPNGADMAPEPLYAEARRNLVRFASTGG